jgi:hypothetical protein
MQNVQLLENFFSNRTQYPPPPPSRTLHRKKRFVSFPSPTKLSLGGNNDVITELFLPKGSLVSDIPAGDGKLVNLFYGVSVYMYVLYFDTGKGDGGGGRVEPERRLEGQQFTKLGRKYQHD